MIEKFVILKRRHNDEFFFNTMISILTQFESANLKYHCYYLPWGEFNDYSILRRKGNLIIFHLDSLVDLDFVSAIASSDPTRKVVYFSSQLIPQNLQRFGNVHIVHWGSDYLLQEKDYRILDPVIKTFDSSTPHWICLNHTPRIHRLLVAAYLNGCGLSQFGDIRINTETLSDAPWQDLCSSKFDTASLSVEDTNVFTHGFDLLKKLPNTTTNTSLIYPLRNNNNASNFNRHLKDYYKSTVVEIVNETCFVEPGLHLTEKFINSIFGMNIPLLIGVPGVVGYVKSLGFDVFDDIVNTDYDTITDPIQRLICAITSNTRLLSDSQFAKESWSKCQARLINNLNWAKHHMHDTARSRTLESLPFVIDILNQTK